MKNFFTIALNKLTTESAFSIAPSSTKSGFGKENLYDLDRNSMWCSNQANPDLRINFGKPTNIGHLVVVEGESSSINRPTSYRIEYSNDDYNWVNIPFTRKSAYLIQKQSDSLNSACTTDTGNDKLAGKDDQQTMILSFNNAVTAPRFRITILNSYGNPCIRELFMIGFEKQQQISYNIPRAVFKSEDNNKWHTAWDGDITDTGQCASYANCVYDGICYENRFKGVFPGETNDLYAICAGNQGNKWFDVDGGQSQCLELNQRFSGLTQWAKSGESNGPGEYGSYTNGGSSVNNGYECCGDDVGEYYVSTDENSACCNSVDKCIDSQGRCHTD